MNNDDVDDTLVMMMIRQSVSHHNRLAQERQCVRHAYVTLLSLVLLHRGQCSVCCPPAVLHLMSGTPAVQSCEWCERQGRALLGRDGTLMVLQQ
jgi:hypothetical protein